MFVDPKNYEKIRSMVRVDVRGFESFLLAKDLMLLVIKYYFRDFMSISNGANPMVSFKNHWYMSSLIVFLI